MTASSSPKYSYRWAIGIVESLVSHHARVSRIALDFWGLSLKQLAFILATRPHEWSFFRDSMKTLDRYLDPHKIQPPEDENYYTAVKVWRERSCRICPENLKKYLTDRKNRPILREQS